MPNGSAKRDKRSGNPITDALYTVQDAIDTLELLVPVSYGDHVELFDGHSTDWYDAGHFAWVRSNSLYGDRGLRDAHRHLLR